MTPLTVTLLNNLKPGQSMVYYRGDFTADIARSTVDKDGIGAPLYARVLSNVLYCAKYLEQQRRVSLSERTVMYEDRRGSYQITEYSATSL